MGAFEGEAVWMIIRTCFQKPKIAFWNTSGIRHNRVRQSFLYDPFRGRVRFFVHRRLHLRLFMLLSSGQRDLKARYRVLLPQILFSTSIF
jgi:hypothetical protein